MLITEGALYPLLQKLEKDQLVESFVEKSGARSRKLYQLSSKGEQALEQLNIDILDFSGTLIQFINDKPSMS